MAGQILRVSGHDIGALALDVAAVKIEVDDALCQQAPLRASGFVVRADIAGVSRIGACTRRVGTAHFCLR